LSFENSDKLTGYKERSKELLSENAIALGDMVVIKTDENEFTGLLMPRYESSDNNHIVIKLSNGYNIGISITKIRTITRTEKQTTSRQEGPFKLFEGQKNIHNSKNSNNILKTKFKIALIGTGGTIASKINYRTGGVSAVLSASDIYGSVPELKNYALIEPDAFLNEASENLRPADWTAIAHRIKDKVAAKKYQGIIVSHGTDTMHYTSAALSFALQKLSIPVVLVGAQRSSDRPSSDAALNLLGAVVFALKAQVSGVFVCMHAGPSDDVIACHLGTRVRKNHTSRRDAFESIDTPPIALMRGEIMEMNAQAESFSLNKRDETEEIKFKPDFDKRVLLLKYYPGFEPAFIDYAITTGYRAIILEGTGLGHVGKETLPLIRKAIESGILVFMTSQCIWGRIRMTVYETGRDLLDAGVIPLSNMLAETATVKAMWALANSDSPKMMVKLMKQNIANEISISIPI
jgi:glutamyl-tRNA(Gln) amidotransferase subunit D